MRRFTPVLILVVFLVALVVDFLPNLTLPGAGRGRPAPSGRDEARPRPRRRPAGRVPGPPGRRQDARFAGRWERSRRSSRTASTRPAWPSPSSRPRASTGSSSSSRASTTRMRSGASWARPASSSSCPSRPRPMARARHPAPCRGPGAAPPERGAAALLRRRDRPGVRQHGQHRQTGGRLPAQEPGGRAVRRLHVEERRQLLRDRARRQGRLGPRDPERDHGRAGHHHRRLRAASRPRR